MSPAAAPFCAQTAASDSASAEPAGPDREHDVDGADHEADCQVVALAQVVPQLAEEPAGVRVALGVAVDRLPQQAHQQVAAPVRAETGLDQLDGQFAAQGNVIGTEQAVMGDAQGLRQQLPDPRLPSPRRVRRMRAVLAGR